MGEAGDPEPGRGPVLRLQLGKGASSLCKGLQPAAFLFGALAGMESMEGRVGGGKHDAFLAADTASAASAATNSPSLRLLPLCPGGDGEVEGEWEGLVVVSDSWVAVDIQGKPHLPSLMSSSPAPPPFSLSAGLFQVCSQSSSRRPEIKAI